MPKAMLYDSSKCMACRGCQVACKQWWELPAVLTKNQGTYENPPDLSAETWNRIRFKEIQRNGTVRWLFTRHSCMHCTEAACIMVCPVYARSRHELGFVTVDQERCIACGRCVEYCPFGAPKLGNYNVSPRIRVELGTPRTVTYNCQLCRDRVEDGLIPACAKSCPTGAIQFGERADLVEQGRARVAALKATYPKAYLYGENELGGLHVMFVLTDESSVHGLPEKPQVGTYPDFSANELPLWYLKAVDEGKLPVLPELGPLPGLPAAPARPGIGWGVPALWSWLGIGVVGIGAAVGWTIRRRIKREEEKQEVQER